MNERIIAGALVSTAIALLAMRLRSLTWSGVIAAVIVGTISAAAGWSWALLLIAFFVVTSGIGAIRSTQRRVLTEGVVEKTGARDAKQVLANGAVYAAAAVAHIATDELTWIIAGFGALAAAASDSWATEVGTLSGSIPRSITDWRPVPVGTSGGITLAGTLAGVGGAAFISLLSLLVGWDPAVAGCVFLGGLGGSTADSVLGATAQVRRRCIQCGAFTERRVHVCGGSTRVVRGLSGLDNDGVNAAATIVGGLVAYLFSLYVLR